jgi:predicted kinase
MPARPVPECVILVGLPGAGKTTFYRDRFANTHAHVSKDLWPHAKQRDVRQQQMVEALLAAGRSVVVDNTNPRREDRAALIAIARTQGAKLIAYFFDVSTRAAAARNQARTGPGRVPPVAIFTTAKRLEPPTRSEGFDELYRVTLDETHAPVVRAARGDEGQG